MSSTHGRLYYMHFSPADDGPSRIQSQEQNISLPNSEDFILELDSSPRFLQKSFDVTEECGVHDNCPQDSIKEEAL